MNISEFERSKPRETYSKIKVLETELESLLEFGKKDIDASYVLSKIKGIKESLKSGK